MLEKKLSPADLKIRSEGGFGELQRKVQRNLEKKTTTNLG